MTKTYQILTNLTCNLRCSYCYENMNQRVSTEDEIYSFLDACFDRDKDDDSFEEVFVEVIGGESLLVPELVDFICVTTIQMSFKYKRKIGGVGITTNGTTLGDKRVREILLNHRNILQIGVSIDGTKENHDKYRVNEKGEGSYDTIIENVPWLIANFNHGVKATFTNETFDTYAEGVINLIELGFKSVAANLVYEEVSDGDECLKQLLIIADYLLEKNDDTISFFQLNNDFEKFDPFNTIDEKRNYCGSCKYMTCLGFDGNIYGCNRFCTMGKPDMEIGKLVDGKIEITNEGLIEDVSNQYQLWDGDCATCNLKSYCPSCVAAPYEEDSVQAYIDEKRMCGWTFAQALVRSYIQQMKNRR